MRQLLFILLPGLLFLAALSCAKDYEIPLREAFKYKKLGSRESVSAVEHKEDIDNLEKAVDKFDQAILASLKATDGKFLTLKAIGIKYIQAQMYLEAVKYLTEAKEIEPSDPKVHYYLGLCYANYANIEKNKSAKNKYIKLAESSYRSGLTVAPDNARLNYSLGLLYAFLMNKKDKGMEYLNKAVEISPKDVNARFALANIQFQMGYIKPAKEQYLEILEMTDSKSEKWQKAKVNLNLIQRKERLGMP